MRTNNVDRLLKDIKAFCAQNSNPALVQKYSRFFVEGYDAYGVDQKVLETRRQFWWEEHHSELGFAGFMELGDILVAGGKYEEVFLGFWFIKQFEKEFTKDTFIQAFILVGEWDLQLGTNGLLAWISSLHFSLTRSCNSMLSRSGGILHQNGCGALRPSA